MFSALFKWVLAFVLGALAFTPWDILLVHFEVVEYTQPVFFGVSAWTPVIFGSATLGAVLIFSLLERLLDTDFVYRLTRLAWEYLIMVAFFVAILVLRSSPYILALTLAGLVLTRLIFFHRNWDFLFFLIGACIGPTVELFLTSFKLYLFTEPDFLGMPYWLPILWGAMALSLRRLSWALFPMPPPAAKSPYAIKLK